MSRRGAIAVGVVVCVSLVAAGAPRPPRATTGPASGPATRPATGVKVRSIESIVSGIPRDAFPAAGEKWGEVNLKIANQWLADTFPGREAELSGYPFAPEPSKDGSVLVLMEYLVRHEPGTRPPVDAPVVFSLRGFNWLGTMDGHFPADDEKRFAKIRHWEGNRMGDRVKFKGIIKSVVVSGHGDEIGIALDLTDCRLTR